MRTSRQIAVVSIGVAIPLLLNGCGREAKQLQAENEALRAEVAALKARTAETDAARESELKRLQGDAQDVARLRGEVTQLRTAAKDADELRREKQLLITDNKRLRDAARVGPANDAPSPAQPESFPREAWSFAGYGSPEAALVSAIWSMRQGNSKQYFESLTAEEQLRMTKVWEGKSQEEISAKHQSDTAQITGVKVLNRQAISPDEMQLGVLIEGVNREEKVSMKRVGNDWKFGGFIREPGKSP